MLTTFIIIRVLDVIDVLLVAYLMYQVYMLIRGTVAINRNMATTPCPWQWGIVGA